MKTIGVIANCTKARANDVVRRIRNRSRELGLEVLCDPETASLIGLSEGVALDALAERADIIVALGGDGTMLRLVRELGDCEKPVMGVNIGGLGFLTSISEEAIDPALQCLHDGHYEVATSSVLECVTRLGKKDVHCYRALNEILVSGVESARVVVLDVTIDGETVNSYVCDGLMVATPVGSTGHSLSAGGPIVAPGSRALVLSAVCPHTLSSRPLVVSDDCDIRIAPAPACTGPVALAVDGQVGHSLAAGESVHVHRSPRSVKLVRLPGASYYRVLRQKLKWRGSTT